MGWIKPEWPEARNYVIQTTLAKEHKTCLYNLCFLKMLCDHKPANDCTREVNSGRCHINVERNKRDIFQQCTFKRLNNKIYPLCCVNKSFINKEITKPNQLKMFTFLLSCQLNSSIDWGGQGLVMALVGLNC